MYVLGWSVIIGVMIGTVLGHHEPRPYKMVIYIHKCCVCSDCPTDQRFLLCPSPCPHRASLFAEIQQS